jgi:hypothetical protein
VAVWGLVKGYRERQRERESCEERQLMHVK